MKETTMPVEVWRERDADDFAPVQVWVSDPHNQEGCQPLLIRIRRFQAFDAEPVNALLGTLVDTLERETMLIDAAATPPDGRMPAHETMNDPRSGDEMTSGDEMVPAGMAGAYLFLAMAVSCGFISYAFLDLIGGPFGKAFCGVFALTGLVSAFLAKCEARYK